MLWIAIQSGAGDQERKINIVVPGYSFLKVVKIEMRKLLSAYNNKIVAKQSSAYTLTLASL